MIRMVWWLGRWVVRRLVWAVAGLVLRGVLGGQTGGLAMRALGMRGMWWRSFRLTLVAGGLIWLWWATAGA